MDGFFTNDPDGDGFQTYATEVEAKKALAEIFESYKEEAVRDDEWPDGVERICAGKIIYVTAKREKKIFEYIIDYVKDVK